MATLPTNRNTGNTATEHVDDHNALHAAFNQQAWHVGPVQLYRANGAQLQNDVIAFQPTGSPSGFVLTQPFLIPDDWSTINIDVIWTAENNATGGVVWFAQAQQMYDGSGIGGLNTVGSATFVTPGSSAVVNVDRPLSGFSVVAGRYYRFGVGRDSDNAADTYAAKAFLWGIVISKAG